MGVADTALSERAWREQLLTAITLLDQGAAVVRLRSRKDQEELATQELERRVQEAQADYRELQVEFQKSLAVLRRIASGATPPTAQNLAQPNKS